MLSQPTLEAILNRPLAANEADNFAKYQAEAASQFGLLLCGETAHETGTRIYPVREGYRTVFTDPMSGTVAVYAGLQTTTAEATDKYTTRLGDRVIVDGGVTNAIVFKKHLPRGTEYISVTATFGFDDTNMPADLQRLFADLFVKAARDAHMIGQRTVKSKRMEDYTVIYDDVETHDQFVERYAGTLMKYAACAGGSVIRHGHIHPVRY